MKYHIVINLLLLITLPFYGQGPSQIYDNHKNISSSVIMKIGDRYMHHDCPDSAFIFYTILANRYNEDNSPEEKYYNAYGYDRQGYIYGNILSDYRNCYTALLNSLEIAMDIGCDDIIARTSLNLSSVHLIYDDYKNAIPFLKESIYAAIRSKRWKTVLLAYFQLTSAAIVNNDYSQTDSLTSYLKRIDASGDNIRQCIVNRAKSIGCIIRGDYADAVHWIDRTILSLPATEYFDKLRIMTIADKGCIFANSNKIDSAIIYSKKALMLAEAHKFTTYRLDLYKTLSSQYTILGQPDSSHFYRIKYLELSDSVFSNQKYSDINDIKNARKFQEIDLQLKKHIYDNKLKAIIIWGMSILMSVICVAASIVYRKNRQLKLRNKELFKRINASIATADNERFLRKKNALAVHQDILYESNATGTLEKQSPLTSSSEQKRTSISAEEMEKLYSAIIDIMESPNIFSQDFSLSMLAKLVNSNVNYVSHTINKIFGNSFSDMLNCYRTKEACRRLSNIASYGNLSIDGIAKGLGYKSRTNFTAVFKKYIGMTPSEYQKIAKSNLK
ncbi:helix-turn-helix domain-containing protein [Xylanibacter rarus]|uniref:helix-turn-helix domain-containing protein n=1 Tax=Xylanibacter rarus TaxID=1676614 RepID=UPI003AB995E2